jgi:RND family efflux transporter MFP subunit
MSGSMFVGRVLLPGIGLLLAGFLALQSFRDSDWVARPTLTLASFTGGTEGPVLSQAPGKSRSPSPGQPRILAEGHVTARPGAEVVLGAEVAGTIARVLVHEKAAVHKGDLLVEFRGAEIRAAAEEAVARVSEVDAELAGIEQERDRLDRQQPKQPGLTEARERVQTRWNVARARRAAAAAGYRRVEAEYARTRVRTPIDGVVVSLSATSGETVAMGSPLLRIVDLTRLRVEAEIDDYDIPRCTAGSTVRIGVPGDSGHSWQGTVEEVAECLIPRRLRPDDPGRPTDTRVLPVRIAFQESAPLKLGQRVEVEIAEGASPTPPEKPIPRLTQGPDTQSQPKPR